MVTTNPNTPTIHNETISEMAAEACIDMLTVNGVLPSDQVQDMAHEHCADYIDHHREGVTDIPRILMLTSKAAIFAYRLITVK